MSGTRFIPVPTALLVVGLLAAVGCSELVPSLTGPGDSGNPSRALVVSEVLVQPAAPALREASFSAGGSADSVAYVSLLQGTVPGGTRATVRNLANGRTVNATMLDGGFDPVAMPALTGDTVEIEVAAVGGGPILMMAPVEPRRPPVVVRTDPPKQKVDVPLNALIVVIFSEPMDSLTIRPDVIQLLRGGQSVSGTVSLEANGWEARFIPAAVLTPNTDYQVVVSTEAADLSGDRLAQAVSSPFSTGTQLTTAVSLTASALAAPLRGRAGLPAGVTARDAAGNLVPVRSVQWSSSDPAIVSIDSSHVRSAWFTARTPGTAGIIAVADGLVDTVQVKVRTLSSFTTIAAGAEHTCATAPGNQVFCWGSNVARQLTQAVALGTQSNLPVAIYAPGDLMSGLTLGTSFSAGISVGDSARWWGSWPVDTIWPNRTVFVSGPSRLVGGDSVIALGTGERHICAVRSGGNAVCWGGNEAGQLGDGQTYLSTWSLRSPNNWEFLPVTVSGGIAFTDVTAGSHHTCGLAAGGTGYCWGDNAAGQVGGGSLVVTSPQPVRGLTLVALRAGRAHTCGLVAGGAAYCWGDNASGQLGTPGPGTGQVPVSGGLAFVDLSLGADHSCGVTASGQAFCWGDNSYGQLGDGSGTGSASPVAVSGGLVFTSVSAGGAHTCGMTSSGLAYCWGANAQGQLGDLYWVDRLTPVLVVGQS